MKTIGAMISIMAIVPAMAAQVTGPPVLAKQVLPARGGGKIVVTSDALTQGTPIKERFTQDGDNHSPPLSWTKGPTGTRSYAVLMEDANVEHPVAHWVVYDIPATVSRLAENQPKEAMLDMGALQGRNVRNETGFIGPKPPASQTHNYHVEVFALNTSLNLDPAKTDRNDLVDAMKGHVLAIGDLIVNYTGK